MRGGPGFFLALSLCGSLFTPISCSCLMSGSRLGLVGTLMDLLDGSEAPGHVGFLFCGSFISLQ